MKKKEDNQEALATIQQDADIFRKFDEMDDKLILKEMENQVIEEWVYHFRMKGKDIFGISKAGVDACQNELSKKGIALREISLDFRVDPTNERFVLFTAKVQKALVDKDGREAEVDSMIGTKRQDTMRKEYGNLVENPFWYEQGSIKALRNAKLRMIPEEIKTKIIEFAKGKNGMVKKVKVDQEKKQYEPDVDGVIVDGVINGEFPIETKEATQTQRTELVRLEATLVDKYHISPEVLLAEIKKRIGKDKAIEFNTDEAKRCIKFFKDTMEYNDKKNGG